MKLRLNPSLDIPALAAVFREKGRVRVPHFLNAPSAEQLRQHLGIRDDWRLVVNAGDRVYEIDRKGQASLSRAERDALDRKIAGAAANGFQFRFESIRVPDDEGSRRASGSLLDEFAQLLSTDPVRALLRDLTGSPDISFADAQATLFSPGDFLTTHDDEVTGKKRRAAYTFGLSSPWRSDWGGLLLFHNDDGDIVEGWTPSFNVLNVFAVPQVHSVSVVAPFAPERRLSVTGWLRADA